MADLVLEVQHDPSCRQPLSGFLSDFLDDPRTRWKDDTVKTGHESRLIDMNRWICLSMEHDRVRFCGLCVEPDQPNREGGAGSRVLESSPSLPISSQFPPPITFWKPPLLARDLDAAPRCLPCIVSSTLEKNPVERTDHLQPERPLGKPQ